MPGQLRQGTEVEEFCFPVDTGSQGEHLAVPIPLSFTQHGSSEKTQEVN